MTLSNIVLLLLLLFLAYKRDVQSVNITATNCLFNTNVIDTVIRFRDILGFNLPVFVYQSMYCDRKE